MGYIRDLYAAAFNEWRRQMEELPEEFLSDEEVERAGEEYGEQCADTFMEMIRVVEEETLPPPESRPQYEVGQVVECPYKHAPVPENEQFEPGQLILFDDEHRRPFAAGKCVDSDQDAVKVEITEVHDGSATLKSPAPKAG